MPLIEHIRELRNRVLKALARRDRRRRSPAGSSSRTVWNFLTEPYCKLPTRVHQPRRPAAASKSASCHLVVTGLFDYFFLHLKLAIAIGI